MERLNRWAYALAPARWRVVLDSYHGGLALERLVSSRPDGVPAASLAPPLTYHSRMFQKTCGRRRGHPVAGRRLAGGGPGTGGAVGIDGARFSAAGALQRPEDYREWVYLTSGLGMTYGPTQPGAGEPRFFDNVFVNRESYKAFLQSGRWPDKTQFILEIRQSEQKASINNGGQTQGSTVLADRVCGEGRGTFSGSGWGYFDFGAGTALKAETVALPTTERCYACHRDNTAVENTFVQFYPTLMDVARRMGTVNPPMIRTTKSGSRITTFAGWGV
jgi:hypothetical protein